ncbi:DNA primase [Candidatus Parcubacteria bacterium]|nr:DNA primase [Patescibacteria group bacterium]MBU4477245.1 DNA primase [Patescibacteria group bacterium]MCG2699354.1 DNA primase [Candidatus Parcubacteria bacterium]
MSSSSVEQIKSRLNIVDVVQGYIKLQKAGANLKANCPFHSEKTPSFFVSPARESWHCFGCNRGGDMFAFVMEIEGVEFVEALKILASRAGIELAPIDSKHKNERARLLKLIDDAKNFYESELKKNKEAIDYLKERGLKEETMKEFGIGFAPGPPANGWRNLYDFLKNRSYSDSEMEKAGLVIKSDKPQAGDYDRFRSRIMFPLYNYSGQAVGFSGRIFHLAVSPPSGGETAHGQAKYINTPQTILYDKSKLLYGLEKAKNEIRIKDGCILVEGQMDVIMSHQAGVKNTVAVSGTALTDEHLRTIKRLTEKLIMAFDSDEAGFNASSRGIDLALAQGFELKIASVPFGKDPADAIKENPAEWAKAVEGAKNIIEFYLESFTKSVPLPESRKKIEKIVLPYVSLLPSEMEKAHWVSEIARRLGINDDAVWQELKKIKFEPSPLQEKGAVQSEKKVLSRLNLLKNRLIGFIFWQKDSEDAELKMSFDKIIKRRGLDLNEIKGKIDIDKLIFEIELFYGGKDSLKEEFERLDLELSKEELRTKLGRIAEAIKKAELSGDKIKMKENLNDFYNFTKKLNELK